VQTELDVLAIVGDRLTVCGIPFMLTGSFALARYVTPRMTPDLDIVAALRRDDIEHVAAAFSGDFYIPMSPWPRSCRNGCST
jgi:hypothetical protein